MVPAVRRGNALSTWSATALPGAAARVVRAAARRRAVRLAMVAGAVFVLGVLFGEQAQAADGPSAGVVRLDAGSVGSVLGGLTAGGDGPVSRGDGPQPKEPAGSAPRPAADLVARERGSRPDAGAATQPAAESGARRAETRTAQPGGEQAARPGAESGARSGVKRAALSLGEAVRVADERVVRPAVERVVRPVAGQSGEQGRPVGQQVSAGRPPAPVLRPVGQVVRGVTQELGAVTSTLSAASRSTVSLPAVSLPAVSLTVLQHPAVLPPQGLPGLPVLPTLPGLADLPAHLLPASAAPAVPGKQAPVPPPTAADIPATPAAPVTQGPRPSVATPQGAPTAPQSAPDSGATTAPPQAPPVPTDRGKGDGALGSRSSADQGTARHADAGAVPAAHRPVPRLVPGAAAPAETPRTREHSRDVHVPPA
ncbi:hypothetical protein OIE82_13355 [Streptomyces althioticus]|uniref:Uncharacterized protein n=1 Tax=Streptomyces althioticus TaxID=83380 RepID=A0ABZ1Y5R4_9ACTN|nr:hypothetical protein OG968_13620 [Streptomyces althioticus]